MFLSTLGGVGRVQVAPGTAGTALAWLFFWFFLPQAAWAAAIVAVLLFVLAVPISAAAEHRLGEEDPGAIVIDEAVGMCIAVVGLPHEIIPWLLAFAFFRFFDIAKPLFINRIQRLPGGLGVVADDALAGLYANLLLHVFFH